MNAHKLNPRPAFRRIPGRERGAVLFIALIVLVAMMLASVALVRSVDTANVIAGNLAFKQAALQASDLGVEAAVTNLPTIIATTLDNNVTGSGGTYWYYATRRDTDASGVPTTRAAGSAGALTPVDWNAVPVATTVGGNAVRIVIDRLCRGPAPVTDIEANCFHEGATGGSSNVIGAARFTAATTVYYRVTAQVSGPRNTVSMVQAVIGI